MSPANLDSHTSFLRRLFGKTDTPKSAPVPTAPEKKPARNKKVLVVDDDPLFLKLASTQLESDGYEVVTAQDGSEAIEVARKQRPHVVLLDVNLPADFTGVDWDGFRLLTWMRRFEALKTIPIVMMTSSNPAQYTREAIRSGATAFFHKRLDGSHLLTLVHQALTRRGLATAVAAPTGSFQT